MLSSDLLEAYKDILRKYEFSNVIDAPQILSVIHNAITDFMSQHKKVAIYCNGYHTKMLMADFIFELKDAKIIIDNYKGDEGAEGFQIICAKEMEANHVDGVIISSFDYMESISKEMEQNYPEIAYLNIYQKIREAGINLQNAYYENAHPYQYYKTINSLQKSIREGTGDRDELYHQLIGEYIRIKDFRSAIIKTREWDNIELLHDLEELYDKQLEVVKNLNNDHVLMLCIDGMRGSSLSKEMTPKLLKVIEKKGQLFTRAYSYSTSTYESLIPIYSENSDMRTRYYDQNFIRKNGCRFVQHAKKQGRDLLFYTDMTEFVEDSEIKRSNRFQAATEKIWDFIVDAQQSIKGLFYVHILYESHYSFVNPYTAEDILAEGTAMLFDYLEAKGGKLRADYVQQHQDAMHYLDDVISPILERLTCPVVIFADHGNTLLSKETKIEEISTQLLTCHEDLIKVPLAVFDGMSSPLADDKLISLMELNDIIIRLMDKCPYNNPEKRWVKIGRSQIYNPDFHFLYSKLNQEYRLKAFEGFIFDTGEKLVVYSDGKKELYSTTDDSPIYDEQLIERLYSEIGSEVTVC